MASSVLKTSQFWHFKNDKTVEKVTAVDVLINGIIKTSAHICASITTFSGEHLALEFDFNYWYTFPPANL